MVNWGSFTPLPTFDTSLRSTQNPKHMNLIEHNEIIVNNKEYHLLLFYFHVNTLKKPSLRV